MRASERPSAAHQCRSPNRTGARLWELLEAGHDLEQAQDQMLNEFDVDKPGLRNEVNALVRDLMAKGLLESDGKS
jgi:hypothetical protein